MPPEVLVAVIACPKKLCGHEFEGTWAAPDDPLEENPEDQLQLCPECGCIFAGRWPGPPLTEEA